MCPDGFRTVHRIGINKVKPTPVSVLKSMPTSMPLLQLRFLLLSPYYILDLRTTFLLGAVISSILSLAINPYINAYQDLILITRQLASSLLSSLLIVCHHLCHPRTRACTVTLVPRSCSRVRSVSCSLSRVC